MSSIEIPTNEHMDEQIKIMISSAVYGFETEIRQIAAYLTSKEYDVICSLLGTVRVDPRKSNLDNSLAAVDDCDIFLGIIRLTCGTGYVGNKNITFEEMKRAIESGKPCWFVVENNVVFTRRLIKDGIKPIDTAVQDIWEVIKEKNKHFFDPLCLKMYEQAERLDVQIEERTGNWIQSFASIEDIIRFLKAQLDDKEKIRELINM